MVVSNHQILLSILLGLSVCVTVLLSILLIPRLGLIGTSIARTTSSWLYFISVEFYVSRFVLPRNRGVRQALKPLLASLIMMVIVWFLRDLALYLSIPLGALIYGALIFILLRPSLPWSQKQGLSGPKGS
jgi:O-antigen/teichoic acid export membrane protein